MSGTTIGAGPTCTWCCPWALLVQAAERSHLPEAPTARAVLHDLLLRIRLGAAAVRAA